MAKKASDKKNIPSLLIMGLLGLFLIFWPNASLNIAGKLAGIALLLVATAGICTWLKDKSRKPADLARLIGSAAAAVIGLWILFNTRAFEKFIPVALGVAMIVFGAVELYRAFRGGKNVVSMVLAGIAVVLGLVVACDPFATIKLTVICAGVALVYTAVTGIMSEMKLGK